MFHCLHSALVSSQKGVAVWTFVFHLVQIVNAAWDTGTTPKSENQKKNEIQAYFIEFDIFYIILIIQYINFLFNYLPKETQDSADYPG